jgi:regulator of protease activity HflC (stomatin/prohibitin superfamily)
MSWALLPIVVVVVFLFSGVRIVRPVERGLVERLGKYRRLAVPGFNWVIPIVDTRRWPPTPRSSFRRVASWST